MAFATDLVRVVAEVTGDSEATLTVLARSVREAGFITTRGRGMAAAQMTVSDAVSLLLGVASPCPLTKVAEAVAAVQGLRLCRPPRRHADLKALGLKVGQTLRECLCHLFDTTGGGFRLKVTSCGGHWSATVDVAGADQAHTLDFAEIDWPPSLFEGKVCANTLSISVARAVYRALDLSPEKAPVPPQ